MAAAAHLSSSQEQAAIEAATALGLSGGRAPKRKQYDHALVLGGLIRACITRPRYARELMESGIELSDVVALGGFRPLKGDEITLASVLGVDASNEFEAMVAGVRFALGIADEPSVERSDFVEPANDDWAVATFPGYAASVIAAPSRLPDVRRANTADTFAWWGDKHPDARGSHVLLITSQIYVPYQGAVAIQNLGMPYGVTVETVGVSTSAADLGPHTQAFSAANYLQEIRSAIGGHLALRDLLVES
ncbi:hypothetical protein [Klenkia sp. PcliD-1-E]|uniref:hypothetical protein n=1 Tax=Klenkia sp. PcliD-1-E TaxID=2954492 RepID=UPI0020975084|nr:hypothetical protein [Klenkia sp. PcliD-1-E]MCO7218997.1 hypothetical protein [Klenkia sp. PcliD-1-E]